MSAILAYQAVLGSGVPCTVYQILNGVHDKEPPLNATDVVELDDKMWGYRMAIIEIYSPFYPDLARLVRDVNLQRLLLQEEYFRVAH